MARAASRKDEHEPPAGVKDDSGGSVWRFLPPASPQQVHQAQASSQARKQSMSYAKRRLPPPSPGSGRRTAALKVPASGRTARAVMKLVSWIRA